MKLFVIGCFVVLMVEGVFGKGVLKRDVNEKALKKDEDVYGELNEQDTDLQKDQEDYYDEAEVSDNQPLDNGARRTSVKLDLLSKPETFVQMIGETVRLPCSVSSKDALEVIRVWSKNSNPIFQGDINIKNKHNYLLLPNGTLQVVLEDAEDFGTYSCTLLLSDSERPEVEHKIIQKTSANITALYSNNKMNVFETDDSATLTCEVTGYPRPTVSWYKDNDKLADGESLTIQRVKPKHAGAYRCFADNKIGKPAHQHINIYVNHKPLIQVDKYIVNSDHESDAELICDVSAYPAATVNWQKDGETIVSNEPKIKLERRRNNERNVLIIKDLNEKDFGKYSCVAWNSLGKETKDVNLVKTPVVRKFEKNQSNESTKDVILQWKVESKQPISMHELQYRKQGETNWKTISPDVTDAENDVYLIKHTLKNLEPGLYETRARSKNGHGWSEYSKTVPFEGESSLDIPAQHRSEELVPVGESTSSSTSLTSSLILVLLTVLTLRQ
ncbi:neurotrimin-like isoform X2 [Anthonomus grandis grandis]|uniref:neurotrimin-like isoform X2 n=1 Tax=Anthonomus grandis grandis TaxID=2921223 RepID=UPI0021653401|nr:neurotrimin-like isoform X2 [Anthonomus grandis grandis]